MKPKSSVVFSQPFLQPTMPTIRSIHLWHWVQTLPMAAVSSFLRLSLLTANHVRVRLEADIFFHEKDQDRPLQGFNDTNLFGYFSGNDQLVARLTYQF
ncbi:MAG: hypothetical protein MH186_14140 [Marinobacter sp.]|nr:hypothetical protein [Marinobacter sp.]